jgi:hypothetical protein
MLKPNLHRFFKYLFDDKYTQKYVNKFIFKIDTTPGLGPEGDCWEWIGTVGKKQQYGLFSCRKNGKKIQYRSHRVAYELYYGILIPYNMMVCHHCDNPKCCNPLHLFLGTALDNSNDKINKSRQPDLSGEKCGHAKLSWNQVNNIREDWDTGKYTQQQLSNKYNIVPSGISSIICNKNWHDPNYIIKKRKYIHKGSPILSDKQIKELRNKWNTGKYTRKQLSIIYNVCVSNIQSIIKNKTWVDDNYAFVPVAFK